MHGHSSALLIAWDHWKSNQLEACDRSGAGGIHREAQQLGVKNEMVNYNEGKRQKCQNQQGLEKTIHVTEPPASFKNR